MRFNEILKKQRHELNLTQKEVIESMGNCITLRAYMAYEQKNVFPRSIETLNKLMKSLKIEELKIYLNGDFDYIEDKNFIREKYEYYQKKLESK